MANCSCRDDPASPTAVRVAEICPKVLVEAPVAVRVGLAKFAWFSISKASIRTTTAVRSVIRVVFSNDRSESAKPGPVSALRCRLPNPAGWAKNEQPATRVAQAVPPINETFPLARVAPRPVEYGPTSVGRIVPGFEVTPLYVEVVTTFIGLPLCSWVMLASSQPSTSRLPWNGRFQTPEKTKWLRASKSDSP